MAPRKKKDSLKKSITTKKIVSKKRKPAGIKCKLKQCLCCEKGLCEAGPPTIMKQVKPNSIKCKFFDNDFEKTWKEFKNAGGVLGSILRSKGKYTEEDLKEAKKKIRKPRKDKGQKRGKKKKNG